MKKLDIGLKDVGLFVLGGLVGGIAVGFTISLLSADLPPSPTVPVIHSCKVNGDCTALGLACADCMICHEATGQCTYGIQQHTDCPCVERERRNCPGGQQECVEKKTDPGHTEWGPCNEI
jgi:hypothetical protein